MSNQGNGGIHSKFQERMRKIRLLRAKRDKQNQQFIQDKVQEIRETIRQEPTIMVYREKKVKGIGDDEKKKDLSVSQVVVDIQATSRDRNYGTRRVGIDEDISNLEKKPIGLIEEKDLNQKHEISDKSSNRSKIDVSSSKKVISNEENKKNTSKESTGEVKRVKRVGISTDDLVKDMTDSNKKELLQQMGVEIIDKIKNSFEDKLDELEVLESELYFLRKDQENELVLKKVKEIKKRVYELMDQVNTLIDQYNLYSKNYYIDHVIGIDDNVIVDDIIQYRDVIDSFDDEKKFVKEIKALDEFKGLYRKLKGVRDDTEKLVQDNEKKIEEFNIRDQKYNDIKLGVVKVNDINKECSFEIEKQNKYFSNLMEKINQMNREEYTTYHLRGIGELVGQSLRYMGMMMVSPLAGLLPGIGMQTLMTRRMIHNIYQNMRVEEVHHVHYEAVNYDSELSHHLTDVDYTSILLEDTLKDIERLKDDFMLQYDSRIPGYEDTLKKIMGMENKIIHNQNKVDIIKNNLKRSKKFNEVKMQKVRRLNEEN